MQQERERASVRRFFPQDRGGILVGVTRMYAQRHVGQPSGADMGAEVGGLDVARGAVVEIVQTAFANANNARMSNDFRDLLRARDRRFGRMVRMHAGGAPQIVPSLDQRGQRAGLFHRRPDRHHLTHARRRRSVEHRGEFHRRVVVQMAVAIDQHQAAGST